MYTIPVSDTKNQYNYIRQLISVNRNENKVTIDYSKVDNQTKEDLKQAISKTIDNCRKDTTYTIQDTDNEILDKLLKENTSSGNVTIDYEVIEPFQVKFSIKGAIHEVLKNRSAKIYKDLLLRSGNV